MRGFNVEPLRLQQMPHLLAAERPHRIRDWTLSASETAKIRLVARAIASASV